MHMRFLIISFTSLALLPSAAGAQTFLARPMGRFLHVDWINTAAGGAQGSTSSIALAAYAG